MRILLLVLLSSVLYAEVPSDAYYIESSKEYHLTDNSNSDKSIHKIWFESGELKEESVTDLRTGKSISKYYTKEGYLEAIVNRDENGKLSVKNFYKQIPEKKPWIEKKKLNEFEILETVYSSSGRPGRKDIMNSKTGERRTILYSNKNPNEDEILMDIVVKNLLFIKVYVNKGGEDIQKVNEEIISGKRGRKKPTKRQIEEYLKKGVQYLPQPPIP